SHRWSSGCVRYSRNQQHLLVCGSRYSTIRDGTIFLFQLRSRFQNDVIDRFLLSLDLGFRWHRGWSRVSKSLHDCLNHLRKPIKVERVQNDIAAQVSRSQPKGQSSCGVMRELGDLCIRSRTGLINAEDRIPLAKYHGMDIKWFEESCGSASLSERLEDVGEDTSRLPRTP